MKFNSILHFGATQEGVRDLAELRMRGDWTSASTLEFLEAFAKLRHEMGRPQLMFFVGVFSVFT